MKFRRDAPLVLTVTVVMVVAALMTFSVLMFRGLTREIEQDQFRMMRAILAAGLRSGEDRALARAEILANLPTVRQHLASRDRAALLAECEAAFAIQNEKYGVDQTQFHLPPAISFLRLHAPEKFGDDLSAFRPMVVAVNADGVPRKGPVIARTGPAIFGVAPLRDLSGSHVGTVDVGMDFGPVLDALKATYQIDLALFVAEEPLRKFATGIASDVITEQNRRGKYIKCHATHWDRMRDLVLEADLATMDEVSYTRPAQGTTYGVVLMPLRNPAGDTFGILAAAKDFGGTRASAGRMLVWQSLAGLFAIVLLAGVVLVVLRGFLLRPLDVLSERFDEMAKGGSPRPMEGKWCAEIEKLVASYEKMRREREEKPSSTPEGGLR
jgi:methyl-accepting chemotaxis protein